jgi:serine/threonine protein kinase
LTKLGRYEVLNELGKGAMGVVYLAKDPVIGRLVAIKTIRTSTTGDDDSESREFRERFLREAQTAGILSHPNIVTIHDIGEDAETRTSFIAMEYIEGRNLKSLLGEKTRFSPDEAADLVAQIAEALDYAHRKGIIHRDVKPANVIITTDGKVKITDFGIAKIASSNLTTTGQFLGTPNYMSPEQVSGAPVDGRSDIFSLGVVLYELLTNRKPFHGENLTAISYKIVHEDFTPPTELSVEIPIEFNTIVARAMAKDPWNRYQRGKDLALALYQLKAHLEEQRALQDLGTMVSAAENLPTLKLSNLEQLASESARETAVPPPVTPPLPSGEETARGAEPTVAPALPPADLEQPPPIDTAKIRSLPLPTPQPAPPPAALQDWKKLARAEVNPKWFWTVVTAGAALFLLLVGFFLLRASLASRPTVRADTALADEVRQTRKAIDEGKRLFAAGRYQESLSRFRGVLSRSPNNQEARQFAQMAENALKGRDEEAKRQVQAAEVLALAQSAFAAGNLEEARTRAEEVLALDGGNLEAQRLREQTAAKIAAAETDRKTASKTRDQAARRRDRKETSPPPSTGAAAVVGPVAPPAAAPPPPEATTATLRLLFNSPVSEGHVMVAVNDQILLRQPFSFKKKAGLFKTIKETGTVTGSIPVPPGAVKVQAWLSGPDIAPTHDSTTVTLTPGETRVLRLEYSSGRLVVRIQ